MQGIGLLMLEECDRSAEKDQPTHQQKKSTALEECMRLDFLAPCVGKVVVGPALETCCNLDHDLDCA